jgi:prolipoprotein diacylglyceryl transferase
MAAIPSPSSAVWQVWFLPIRAYALCIILGIIAACVITEIRMRRRGAPPYAVLDIAVWAVPFGIIGARIYHVITSPSAYFGENGEPIKALYIWQGGLGIWGAVAGGAFGAWLACRQMRIPLTFVADALAPGLPVAQAIGRLGNWFNNELYGKETTLPWGLEIHEPDPTAPGELLRDQETGAAILKPGLFHPTFLYELLWNLGVALLVWLADRKYRFGKGRAFALYVMAYTAGRAWIEAMRIDEAEHIAGLRVNVWVSIIVFLGALVYFVRVRGPQEYLLAADGGFRVVTREEFQASVPAESASADVAAEATDGAGEATPTAEASTESDDAPPGDAPPGDAAPAEQTDDETDEVGASKAEARSGDER